MDVPAAIPQITWILPVPLFVSRRLCQKNERQADGFGFRFHLTGIGYSFLGTCAGSKHIYVS